MFTKVNRRYVKLVSNVKIWSEYFPGFGEHLLGLGFPIENGVLFVCLLLIDKVRVTDKTYI
jgi:hypothetical protein